MKWLMCFAALSLGLCGTGVIAAPWSDSFEGYTANQMLPSPYADNMGVYAYPELGYGGSQCAGTTAGTGWAFTNRSAEGNTVIEAKGYISAAEDRILIGFSPAGNLNWDVSMVPSRAEVGLALVHRGWDGSVFFDCESLLFDDTGNFLDWDIVNAPDMLLDTWYDFRLSVGASEATSEYKLATDATWTTIGTVKLFDGFAPNFVCIGAKNGGRIDDLSATVPEPGALVALFAGLAGLSGAAVRRRR